MNGGNCMKEQNIDFPPLHLASMFPTTNGLVPDDLTVYMLQLIFLSQVNFIFLLFLGMVMNANEVETKEK